MSERGSILAGVPPDAWVRMCWAGHGLAPCGGRVSWSTASGEWRSACPKCGATGRAASGERNALDAAAIERA